jgi:hypothetical protein
MSLKGVVSGECRRDRVAGGGDIFSVAAGIRAMTLIGNVSALRLKGQPTFTLNTTTRSK